MERPYRENVLSATEQSPQHATLDFLRRIPRLKLLFAERR